MIHFRLRTLVGGAERVVSGQCPLRAVVLLGGAILASAATAWGAPAVSPNTAEQATYDEQQIIDLVRRLGDPSFRVRENAMRTLAQVGVAAKEELLKALRSPDAEVRYRARLILADVLEQDWRQRLEAFVDDADGKRVHDLPGWPRFRALLGDEPLARKLFAEMQRTEPALMEAAEAGAQSAGTAFDSRCQQIQDALRVPGRAAERQLPLGSVAALLFVGSEHGVPISMQSAMYVTNFCYQQPFRQAVAGGDNAPLLKKLVANWVRRDFADDSTAAYQTMMLALQFNVREGVEPALTMLNHGNGNPHMRQYAVLVVGKFGLADDAARLEPLLGERAVCAQQQTGDMKVIETQLRDVVLAAMVHLTGQKLADYGFERAQPNATILFNTATLGFAREEDRDAALAKWRAWRGAQGSSPK